MKGFSVTETTTRQVIHFVQCSLYDSFTGRTVNFKVVADSPDNLKVVVDRLRGSRVSIGLIDKVVVNNNNMTPEFLIKSAIRAAGADVVRSGQPPHALVLFDHEPTTEDWATLVAAFAPAEPNPGLAGQ